VTLHLAEFQETGQTPPTGVDLFTSRGTFRATAMPDGDMPDSVDINEVAAHAVKLGELGILELLLEDTPTLIHARFVHRDTLLSLAAQNGRAAICHTLLALEADVEAVDISGENSLHWASRNGHHQIAKMLLDAGLGPNVTNLSGWSALHYACCNGHTEVVEVLLASGADPTLVTLDGENATFMAAKNTHKDVLELLMSGGRPGDELDALYGDKTVVV